MSHESSITLPGYQSLPEPRLAFHPDKPEYSDIHPLIGLCQFGPYSRRHNFKLRDPIQIGILCPSGSLRKTASLFAQLKLQQSPRERRAYLQDFPGFSQVFGIGLEAPKDENAESTYEIPEQDLLQALKLPEPQSRVAELILAGIRNLAGRKHTFDVLAIYLPDWLAPAFKSDRADDTADFDLHDTIKAVCATSGIPVQIVNDEAHNYFCRCSVAWRLSLALYTKAGGIPWKLAGFDRNEAYVGLSYCLRKGDAPRFVTCCSQIFDAEGTNLRFLLYESRDGLYEGKNPYMSRLEMRRVMSRTIDLYQRQKGLPPSRLVVHKTTPFKSEEVDGCMDALGAIDDLELLTVSSRSPWQAVKIDRPAKGGSKGQPANYPVDRGTVLPISDFDYLLWTQGTASGIGDGKYFKEGKGIPYPLLVTRHLGTGGAYASARELLSLSKMNWNNDSLYDRLPVTLSYASVLARVVKRLGSLSSSPYDFRYFM